MLVLGGVAEKIPVNQEDVGLQTCIGCGDQSKTSDRRSSSWAEGSGPWNTLQKVLATYVKMMSCTQIPMFWMDFSVQGDVLMCYFLYIYGYFSIFWLDFVGVDAMHLPKTPAPQGGAIAGDDSQVFARFVGGTSFKAGQPFQQQPCWCSFFVRPMKGAKPDVDYLLTVLQTVSIPPVPVPWHAWKPSLERCKWSITEIALKRDSGLFKNSMPSTTLEWKVPR